MIYINIKYNNETISLSVHGSIEINYDKEYNATIPYLNDVSRDENFFKAKALKLIDAINTDSKNRCNCRLYGTSFTIENH